MAIRCEEEEEEEEELALGTRSSNGWRSGHDMPYGTFYFCIETVQRNSSSEANKELHSCMRIRIQDSQSDMERHWMEFTQLNRGVSTGMLVFCYMKIKHVSSV